MLAVRSKTLVVFLDLAKKFPFLFLFLKLLFVTGFICLDVWLRLEKILEDFFIILPLWGSEKYLTCWIKLWEPKVVKRRARFLYYCYLALLVDIGHKLWAEYSLTLYNLRVWIFWSQRQLGSPALEYKTNPFLLSKLVFRTKNQLFSFNISFNNKFRFIEIIILGEFSSIPR